MTDVTRLLDQMRSYRDAVERHTQIVRTEMDVLDPRANALFDSFEGAAAEDFRERWSRTRTGFGDYAERCAVLLRLLDGKIADLAELDTARGGG